MCKLGSNATSQNVYQERQRLILPIIIYFGSLIKDVFASCFFFKHLEEFLLPDMALWSQLSILNEMGRGK